MTDTTPSTPPPPLGGQKTMFSTISIYRPYKHLEQHKCDVLPVQGMGSEAYDVHVSEHRFRLRWCIRPPNG